MSEENKALVRRLVDEVQNGHSPDKLDGLLTPDFFNHTARAGTLTNREGAKQFHRTMFSAFPDIRVTIHNQAAEGDKVWTHKSFRGTHRGEFLGVPATGKEVSWDVIDILTISGGKITEHWAVGNQGDVLRQIGGST